jgi:glycosyltransferase involved in cell wall biosynthesis
MHILNYDPCPTVSILLCTYNRASFLDRCIESVLNQSNAEWELLVIDDGSSDNTYEIVSKYLSIYPNIRYLKHQNKKLPMARNIGIMASFGLYITFIDSDDLYAPNHIDSRINYMTEFPDIDMIQGGIQFQEEIWLADYYNPGQLINIRECVVGPTFFAKREVYFKMGGFNNLNYGEDAEFWARAKNFFNLQSIYEPETYIYMRADDSITKLETKKITG